MSLLLKHELIKVMNMITKGHFGRLTINICISMSVGSTYSCFQLQGRLAVDSRFQSRVNYVDGHGPVHVKLMS